MAQSVFKDAVIEREGGGRHGFVAHAISTACLFVPALALGCAAGALLALVAFSTGLFGASLERFLEFFRCLPPLIFIPFLLLAFDASYLSVFATGFLYSTYSFFFYWLAALRKIPKSYTESATLLGAGAWQLSRTVLLPGSVPDVVAGLRISGCITLGIMVAAEYLGAPMGIGRTLKFAVSYSSATMLFTGIFWAIMLAVGYEVVVVLVGARLLRWARRGAATRE